MSDIGKIANHYSLLKRNMPKKTYSLKYGHEVIEFELESRQVLGIIKPANIPPLRIPRKRIRKAIANPTDSLPLSKIVKSNEKIAIIVSDKTRVTKANLVLPILLDTLNQAGIKNKDVFIVFALGSHPQQSKGEMVNIIGSDIAKRINFFEHDAQDFKNLKYMGKTSRGTVVEISKKVVDADRIIVTGAINYHYYAGFSGGRKSIIPGIASHKTTKSNHQLVLSNEGAGSHPLARTSILRNNPVHEDMVEAAKFIKVDFLINVVLKEDNQLSEVFAGDLISAHLEGCRYVNDNCRVHLKKKADVVIVSSGGNPNDIDFVQAHKAIDNSVGACKNGGTIIVVAACPERFPSDQYDRWFRYEYISEIEENLRKNFSIAGHTVYSIRKKANNFNIILISDLNDNDIKIMGMVPAQSVKDALEIAYQKRGSRNLSIYLIPQGINVYPVCVQD